MAQNSLSMPGNFKEGLDRLSGFPDDVAHQILRLLSMDDLARLSTVSKRCHWLCLTIPYLTFDNRAHVFSLNSARQIQRNKCLDAFMNLRSQHGVKTQSFCLRWSFLRSYSDEELYTSKWFFQVPHRELEELEVEVTPKPGNRFEFHLPVFNCESLKTLALNLNMALMKMPSSLVDLQMLARLSLTSMHIKDQFLRELVSSHCKRLNFLRISNCTGLQHVSIISSSLQQLELVGLLRSCTKLTISAEKLHTLAIHWFPVPTKGNSSFTISAPVLKFLYWVGGPFNYFQCTGGFPHLRRSALNIYNSSAAYSDHIIYNNLDHVVRSVGHSRLLQTCLVSVEFLVKWKVLPYTFIHASCLIMSTNCLDDYQVPLLADFLLGTPNLKFLRITSHLNPRSYTSKTYRVVNNANLNVEFWESRNLVFVRHLQTLEMELFQGRNEVELLKFLLKNAEKLYRVTVYYSPPFPENAAEAIRECKRASTKLSFLAKKEVIIFSCLFASLNNDI